MPPKAGNPALSDAEVRAPSTTWWRGRSKGFICDLVGEGMTRCRGIKVMSTRSPACSAVSGSTASVISPRQKQTRIG